MESSWSNVFFSGGVSICTERSTRKFEKGQASAITVSCGTSSVLLVYHRDVSEMQKMPREYVLFVFISAIIYNIGTSPFRVRAMQLNKTYLCIMIATKLPVQSQMSVFRWLLFLICGNASSFFAFLSERVKR